MAERVLPAVAQLGHGTALRVLARDEDRVVAEATAAGSRSGHDTVAAALEDALLAAGLDIGERADVVQCAARRDLGDQQREVLLVSRVFAGVARRADPRA